MNTITPQKQALALGLKANEYEKLVSALARTPSYEEMAVTGALWSEHCSYKSSRVHLSRFHTEEPWVWQGPGENAGVVGLTANWGIAFKMESHNHPTYIEPYQGAATGVGGILRDVFCMGAWPIANMNCLRFGYGTWNDHCLKRAVEGIADYGNSVGVPTVTGDLAFHPRYSKNVLVNAFNAGLISKNGIFKGVLTEGVSEGGKKSSEILTGASVTTEIKNTLFPEGENLLCYFGQATGRDGVHGATMSSSEFSSGAESLKPTVQVGDPFAERKLLEATRALIASGKVIGLQDMGAAGLTSSSVEMAGRSGCGVALDLNKVPQRAANMQAFELLLSESQERMLAAVEPKYLDEIVTLLSAWDVEIAIVGSVNATGRFVCLFDNKVCVSMPIETLTDQAPKYTLPVATEAEYKSYLKEIIFEPEKNAKIERTNSIHHAHFFPKFETTGEAFFALKLGTAIETHVSTLETLLSHPTFGNRTAIFQHYCATVQGNTVAGCGALQDAAAAVVRLPDEAQCDSNTSTSKQSVDGEFLPEIGMALAGGCEERWVECHPLFGSQHSTLKVARKLIAVGSRPLAMTDCLNFGSPLQPVVMKQLSDSVDGITKISRHFKIPVVSGNVSLNNQTDGVAIPPTPMIGMVGKIEDCAKIRKTELSKSERSKTQVLTLLWINSKELMSNLSHEHSLAQWIIDGLTSSKQMPLPQLVEEQTLWELMLNDPTLVAAPLARPIGNGGVLVSMLKSAFQNEAALSFSQAALGLTCTKAFAEIQAGFLIGLPAEQAQILAKKLSDRFTIIEMGFLTFQNPQQNQNDTSINTLARLQKAWKHSLKPVFPFSPVSSIP